MAEGVECSMSNGEQVLGQIQLIPGFNPLVESFQ